MRCPFCRSDNDRVIDSRACEEGAVIRRRRQCLSCERRYTTYERIEEAVLKVVKKDGSRVPFDREKLVHGMTKACSKRPVTAVQIEALVTEIENLAYDQGDHEVQSRQIGEWAMERLKALDPVAFVRFASVYRDFQEPRDFLDQVEPLVTDPRRQR